MCKNKRTTLPSWNAGWNQLECTISMKAGCVCLLFFVFFTILCVLHRSNPKHDYSCSWNPANPSTQNNETKTILIKPMWKKKKKKKKKRKRKSQTQQLIKQSNLTNGTNQTDLPSKRNRSNPAKPPSINPSTATKFQWTHQTRCRSTHPPPLSSQIKPIKPAIDQPIKPTADQPIHHHRVPKSRN